MFWYKPPDPPPPEPEPKIRGRCRCGHFAFMHRVVDARPPIVDPCRHCNCGYWERGNNEFEDGWKSPKIGTTPWEDIRLTEVIEYGKVCQLPISVLESEPERDLTDEHIPAVSDEPVDQSEVPHDIPLSGAAAV